MTWRARASSTCRIVATWRWTMRELRDMGGGLFLGYRVHRTKSPSAILGPPSEQGASGILAITLRQSLDQSRHRVLLRDHVHPQPSYPRRLARHGSYRGDPDSLQKRDRPRSQEIAEVLDGAARRKRGYVDPSLFQFARQRFHRLLGRHVRLVDRDDIDATPCGSKGLGHDIPRFGRSREEHARRHRIATKGTQHLPG